MSAVNFQDLIGNYKKTFGKRWQDKTLPPNSVYLYRNTDFDPNTLGEQHNWPVVLGYPQGFAYAGTSDEGTDYASSISSKIAMAKADGYRWSLSVDILEKMIARAKSSQASFNRVVGIYQSHLIKSGTRAVEEMMIDGQMSRGRVTSTTNVNTTTTWVNFTSGYWSGGKWFFRQNGEVSFFNSSTDAPIGQDENVYTIVGYDKDNERLKVTGSSGDITDLETFLAGATDADIYPEGVFDGTTHKEFAGARKFASSNSTIFDISQTNNIMWNGSVQTLADSIDFENIIESIAEYTDKEFDGDLAILLNPVRWANVLNDQAALRRYDKQITSKVENGSRSIMFTSENGTIEIVGHNKMMERQALVIPKNDSMYRIGSQDLQIADPVNGDFIFKLEGSDKYRMVMRNDQAFVTDEIMNFKLIDDIRDPS